MHTHTRTRAGRGSHRHTHEHISKQTYTDARVHTRAHVHTHTQHIHTQAHSPVHTHTRINTHSHTHEHVHAHARTHIFQSANICWPLTSCRDLNPILTGPEEKQFPSRDGRTEDIKKQGLIARPHTLEMMGGSNEPKTRSISHVIKGYAIKEQEQRSSRKPDISGRRQFFLK